MSAIDTLLDGIPIPRMMKVSQTFPRPKVADVEEELTLKLREKDAASLIQPGWKVAVGVGSRGITSLPLMVKVLIRQIKEAGGDPFIVPAMGSHGGASAQGQKEMLIRMGIREEYVEAPIHATMETVQIGETEKGLPVRIDKYASEADAIVVINRIKAHPGFQGPYESGLMKMLTIGLGKQRGADTCHELGFGRMAENVPAIANIIRKKTNLLFGVGVIENAYHEISRIEVLKNEEIPAEEPALLLEAKGLMARIQFDELDVLVIDQIGKDISGTGFDTHAIGRYHTPYVSGGPQIAKVTALDLTDKTNGNANGLGILDFTTRRVFEKFNMEMTYPNSLTSTVPLTVKIPMVLKSDKQSIQAAIKICNSPDISRVRMARIKNTSEMAEIEVSESLLEVVRQSPYLEIVCEPYELKFDEYGNLF